MGRRKGSNRIAARLRVSGRSLRLSEWDPRATPDCKDKDEALARTQKHLERIDALQYRLYAEDRRSLLIVLQGMDTAGKDGVIRRVMTAFNPQAASVWSFKAPAGAEAQHDFLWRIHQAAPSRGEISIFNRSHYEDVLVVRVHDIVPKAVWSKRYELINAFERQLVEGGTRVIKCFLHISKQEQAERLMARLDDPLKHWKFNPGDLDERGRWDDYQRAYQDALARCSTDHAPWYVIPSDRRWYRDLAISEIVAETMAEMDPQVPSVKLDLKRLRARLANAR